ncbi:hypothetical protein F-S17_0428 [Faustovirus]|nr:hypothetical protein F-LCD7_0431 [Faustovirus]QJX72199.1 hypothetical protein F-M6_0436 [Faustovirus]QJX72694.1 hypothetical protein F-S17_0428 [Faustovirus]QJX73190.1 hypothetical protein F-VV57_0429 [Faustovirus]QJX73697.1 hypothetical protein F-VV63_0431 [Faustovirus]
MSLESDYFKIILETIDILTTKLTSAIEKANLERARSRICEVSRQLGKLKVMEISGKELMTYHVKILERNEEFLTGFDFKKATKALEQDDYAADLLDSIRECYKKSTPKEQDYLYGNLVKLLNKYIQYLQTQVKK